MDRIVVVLGSCKDSEHSRYAIFPTSKEDLISAEDIHYLNEMLRGATIVNGSFHKALVLADFEADSIADENNGELPGILVHHLLTCKISPDNLTIERIS